MSRVILVDKGWLRTLFKRYRQRVHDLEEQIEDHQRMLISESISVSEYQQRLSKVQGQFEEMENKVGQLQADLLRESQSVRYYRVELDKTRQALNRRE